jgi:YbbR domain-containing protein
MTAEATWTQRLRRMVLENLGLKLFSLMVSISLFTVVHGSESGQRSMFVPVVAVLPSEAAGKVLVGELPDKVQVTLSGSRSVLNSIGTVDAVQVDLSRAPQQFFFEASAFGFPAGIEVSVTPASLNLEWEQRLERRLPVRVQLAGATDPMVEVVAKPVVTPARIAIKGARSVVEAMKEWATEPISLADLPAGTVRKRVPLQPLPKNASFVDGNEVLVEITLEPRREQRRLRRLPVAALGVSVPVTVRPEHVDVVVAGAERTLEEIDPEHVVPVVDLAGAPLTNGAVSATVTLRGIDESVRVVRIEPAEVLVRAR